MTFYLLLTTIALLLYIQLGTYVFFAMPVRWVNLYFLLATLLYALISLSILLIYQSPETNLHHVYDRIAISAMIGLPLLFNALTFHMHDVWKNLLTWVFRLVLLPAGIILIVRLNIDPVSFLTFSMQDSKWSFVLYPFTFWRAALVIYYLLAGSAIVFQVVAWRITARSKRSRYQADLVSVAAVLFFIAGITTDVILPAAGIADSIFVIHFMAMPPVIVMAYALIVLSSEQYTEQLIRDLIAKEISAHVIFFDPKEHILFANQHTLDTLGYGQFSIQELGVDKLFTDPEAFRFLSQKARLKQSLHNTRISLNDYQGKQVDVTISTIPMHDKLGRYLGFILAGIDISHIVKLEARCAELEEIKMAAVRRNRTTKDLLALRKQELSKVNARLGYDSFDKLAISGMMGRSTTEKELLVQEMHHRVKNNLQIVLALLNLIKNDEKLSQLGYKTLTAISYRILHLSEIHDSFYDSPYLSKIDFSEYITQQVNFFQTQHHKNKRITYIVNSHDVKLSINKALPCAIILKELLDNAFAHAFPDHLIVDDDHHAQPQIRISCKRNDKFVSMDVYDNGQGFTWSENANPGGAGLRIIRQLTRQFLRGQVYISSNYGAYVEVSFKETSVL